MSKSKRGVTRRAFIALGGTAVGTATMAGTADAAEPHKKIHEAVIAMKEAREYMECAHHDFGGYKKDAIELIDRAIHHLRLCLKY